MEIRGVIKTMNAIFRKTFRYSLANAGGLLLYGTFNTFLIFFYTDEVKVDPKLIGIGWFIFAFWNGFNDLFTGWTSEILLVKFKKRKSIVKALILPFILSFILIWLPQSGLFSDWQIFAYFLIIIFIFDLCYSFISLNQYALFPNLFEEGEERVNASSIRSIVSNLIGGVGVIFAPIIYASSLGWRGLAILFATITLILVTLSLPALAQVQEVEAVHISRKYFLKIIRTIFRDTKFLLFIGMSICLRFTFGIIITLIPFYAKYVLYLNGNKTTFIAGTVLASGMVGLIFWNRIYKIMKHTSATMFSLIMGSIFFLGLIFAQNLILTLVAVAFIGFAFGGSTYIGLDLFYADLIKKDADVRLEGIYAGLIGFVNRFPPALIGLILGVLLSRSGFNPDIDPHLQEESVRIVLKVFLIGGSIISTLFAIIFVKMYDRNIMKIEK